MRNSPRSVSSWPTAQSSCSASTSIWAEPAVSLSASGLALSSGRGGEDLDSGRAREDDACRATRDLFFERDFDAAAHTLLPRIEHLLREYLSLSASGIRPTDGTRRGGEILLSTVLADLEGRIQDDWRRFFLVLLTHPLGANVRNDLLHSIRPSIADADCFAVLAATLAALSLHQLHPEQADEEAS